eukprot:3661618-Alexandrium_andersonii.AAC.1
MCIRDRLETARNCSQLLETVRDCAQLLETVRNRSQLLETFRNCARPVSYTHLRAHETSAHL